MKSESEESQRRSPTELGSTEICDFLYVDRARISALYAQLFPQGVLTSVRTTSQSNFFDTQNLGTDVKVFKAGTKSSEGGSEGIEHEFDASWSIPIEVLTSLQSKSLVRTSLRGSRLGSIVLADGWLRVMDYATMRDMWEPSLKMALRQLPKPQRGSNPHQSEIITIMKALPESIHAHFLTGEGFLWSSLRRSDLAIPTDDLMLKHGGDISGQWKILYILDAFPDPPSAPERPTWSAGELSEGVLGAMRSLRNTVGRPGGWFGVTPLMIFRIVNPPPQEQPDAESEAVVKSEGEQPA